ncbi:beta-lactamase [Gloeomargarita lithophora Alchichica-D10]|uniref:Beta-lactamase n=1 Tax=Gloeomargarita lithophora Alchichica-D10 TaxID=1188229 RepID=A0A1J0AEU2_9CYAN|nr:serine hydrolase [Gloeomargarita lithophora]APB34462.1 beta-lactamase [Gloeomargarita lithophora Alchichica-D10]
MLKVLRFLGVAVLLAGLVFGGINKTRAEPHPNPGMIEPAMRAIDKLAQQQVDTQKLPGLAIGIVYQDQVIYAKGFGVREVGKPERIDPDTVFQLASVSKPMGATVVAALVGEGKITWDSKISDLDPAFQLIDPWVSHNLTLRDLYSHRSGLPEHAGDLLEDLGYDRTEVLHRLRYQKLASSFRSRYAYTNFGLTEAAIAAAKAYGFDWADACDIKLYKPLGMTATSSRFQDFTQRRNKAVGHVRVQNQWVHREQRNPEAQSPAGGVSSSVNDMTKWMRLQLGNGRFAGQSIVAAATLAETHFPQIISGTNPLNGNATFYGLGWGVAYGDHLRLSHSGAFALGAATHVALVPAAQLGIVVLTNAAPVGIAEGLAQVFLDTALAGKPTQDWLALYQQAFQDPAVVGITTLSDYSQPPMPRTAALKLAAYTGTYGDNPLVGDIQITAHNGTLTLQIGPEPLRFQLTHYDRDTFTFDTVGENAAGRSGVTFRIGAKGEAESVVIESLHQSGQGEFTRLAVAPTDNKKN